MKKIIFILIILTPFLCSCTKMRAKAWYNNYGIERKNLEKKESIPALINALKDRNVYVRIYSAKEIGKHGTDAKEAIPALVNLLSDPIPQVRMEAAKTISLIGIEGRLEVLPALTKLLLDSNSGVRLYAIAAIETLKQGALDATSNLLAVANDEHPTVRRAAIKTLYQIGYSGEDFIQKLKIMESSDINISNRNTAKKILAELGMQANE